MTAVIVVFGLMTLCAGLVILANPESIFGPLREHSDRLWIQVLAVAVRLALGVLLIRHAHESSFPVAIEVLGWLSIGAAVAFGVMGRRRFLGLMSWAFSLAETYGRAAGLAATAFGGFLVYAFV